MFFQIYLLSQPEPKIETSLGRKWSCNKQVHDMHNFVNINKPITNIATSSTSIVTNIRYE